MENQVEQAKTDNMEIEIISEKEIDNNAHNDSPMLTE